MSVRGTFVTERINCKQCRDALLKFLARGEKHLDAQVLAIDKTIIAGRWGGSYGGQSFIEFDIEWRDEIEALLCHPVILSLNEGHVNQCYVVEFAPQKNREGG